MHYRADSPAFIRIGRTEDARELIEELEQEVLSRRPPAEIGEVRHRLTAARESVSFCLKAEDVEAMGFPLSLAAAGYLVEKAGGLIQSGTYSWMVPNGREVRVVAEFKA